MKYVIYNAMWKYEVITNLEGIIVESNCYPNDEPHWTIGWIINDIKKYYYRDVEKETDVDKITHVYIEQIK